MTISYRKPITGLLALSAALMMPLAFAQATNPTTQSVPPPPPAATSIAPTPTTPVVSSDAPTAPTANTATSTTTTTTTAPAATADATAASGNKKTWSELDVDKDGKISKNEAGADAGLTQIFGKADANADGVLTPDEYKSYVAANYKKKGHQG